MSSAAPISQCWIRPVQMPNTSWSPAASGDRDQTLPIDGGEGHHYMSWKNSLHDREEEETALPAWVDAVTVADAAATSAMDTAPVAMTFLISVVARRFVCMAALQASRPMFRMIWPPSAPEDVCQ